MSLWVPRVTNSLNTTRISFFKIIFATFHCIKDRDNANLKTDTTVEIKYKCQLTTVSYYNAQFIRFQHFKNLTPAVKKLYKHIS